MKSAKVAANKASPILQYFGWHRIILDEGHEILSKTVKTKNSQQTALRLAGKEIQVACGKELFDSFLSNYRWYVSGTPFPRGRGSMIGALNFLQCELSSLTTLHEEIVDSTPIVYELTLFNAIKRCIFWRNTKKSVKLQAKIPPIVEEVAYLHLSPVERAIYKCFELQNDKDNIRLICNQPTTCPLIEGKCKAAGGLTTELAKQMIHYFSSQVVVHRNSLSKYKNALSSEQLLLSELQQSIKKTQAQNKQLLQLKQEIVHSERKINSLNAKIENTENLIIEKMAKSACFAAVAKANGMEFCFLCNDLLDGNKQKLGQLSTCNHTFCKRCIYYHVNARSQCPTCGTTASVTDIKTIATTSCIEAEIQLRKEENERLKNKINTRTENDISYFTDISQAKIDEKRELAKLEIMAYQLYNIHDLEDLWNEIQSFKSDRELQALRVVYYKKFITDDQTRIGAFNKIASFIMRNCSNTPTTNNTQNSQNSSTKSTTNELDLSALTTTYGTKLAALMRYVHDIIVSKDTKIILFSKYDSLLVTLKNALKAEANILPKEFVVCKGNVTQRKKAICAFNSTDKNSPHVLLLSLNNAVSGTHLTVASKIVLVDPVIGSKDEAQATDAQAIARSHRIGQDQQVTAVRFVVKDTIDEDDYNNAYGED